MASFQMNINKVFDELTGIHHRRKRVRAPPKIRPHFHGKGTPISDFGQRLKRFLKWNITFLKRYTPDDPVFGILDMERNQMFFANRSSLGGEYPAAKRFPISGYR